jgi:hypothetical protein
MRSGRGNHCTYRLVPEDAASRGAMFDDVETLAGLIWVMIYRRPGGSRSDISAWLGADSDAIDEALKRLVADGRVVVEPLEGRSVYRAAQFVVPVGSTAGWSGAVFDHFQAVCNAIAAKNGSDTTGWVGKKIKLIKARTACTGGETVERVRKANVTVE